MPFEGSKAILIKDLSGNIAGVLSGLNVNIVGGSVSVGSVSVSGSVVSTSGGVVKISGEVVNTSGQSVALFSGSNIVQLASGFNTTTQGGLTLRKVDPTVVTGLSGGVSLGSGVTPHGIRVKNILLSEGATISGVLFVGGSGTGLAPFSGAGYPLQPGDSIELKVQNFNSIRVSAGLSGASVSAIGIDI